MQAVQSQNLQDTEQNLQELALVRLKLYYFYVLFVFQNEKYRDKIKYYDILHEKIKHLDPNYCKTKYLSKKELPILRPYPMKAIRICTILEKFHLMKLGLLGYHIITKFKYFDQ